MIKRDKNKLKLEVKGKILVLGLILVVLATLFGLVTKVNAVEVENCSDREFTTREECKRAGFIWAPDMYQLLAPLPNADGGQPIPSVDTTSGLGSYLNLMIKIFIGICAVLSVVMIVVGGLEYMTSELISSKQAGKERIEHALLGLLIALGAYALLFTINPDLLKSDVTIPPTTSNPTTSSTTVTPSSSQN